MASGVTHWCWYVRCPKAATWLVWVGTGPDDYVATCDDCAAALRQCINDPVVWEKL